MVRNEAGVELVARGYCFRSSSCMLRLPRIKNGGNLVVVVVVVVITVVWVVGPIENIPSVPPEPIWDVSWTVCACLPRLVGRVVENPEEKEGKDIVSLGLLE